jgi:phage replication-related protein YjqB (UPF0714/DUF867 family)
MSTYACTVKKPLSGQDLSSKEHLSADPEKLATIGRALGQQVRVKRSSTQYALYTVHLTPQESPDSTVRMGTDGRAKIGGSFNFSATVDSQVPHLTYTDAEAETNSEFVERLTDNGTHTGLVAIAPHGGAIEAWTDEQAERVESQLVTKGVSSWRCKGWKSGGGAFDRWHITSTEINEDSFPLLDSIIARGFTYAVSFHGFSDTNILIGGAAPLALKQSIQAAIQAAIAGSGISVDIATGGGYSGDSPANIVNRLTSGGANGIQIEQSLAARTSYWQAIADAVASVYAPLI